MKMVHKYTNGGLWIPQSIYGWEALEVDDRPRFFESVRQDTNNNQASGTASVSIQRTSDPQTEINKAVHEVPITTLKSEVTSSPMRDDKPVELELHGSRPYAESQLPLPSVVEPAIYEDVSHWHLRSKTYRGKHGGRRASSIFDAPDPDLLSQPSIAKPGLVQHADKPNHWVTKDLRPPRSHRDGRVPQELFPDYTMGDSRAEQSNLRVVTKPGDMKQALPEKPPILGSHKMRHPDFDKCSAAWKAKKRSRVPDLNKILAPKCKTYERSSEAEKLGKRVASQERKVEQSATTKKAPALCGPTNEFQDIRPLSGRLEKSAKLCEDLREISYVLKRTRSTATAKQALRQFLTLVEESPDWRESWIEHAKQSNCETTSAFVWEYICDTVESLLQWDKEGEDRRVEEKFQNLVQNLLKLSKCGKLDQFVPDDLRLQEIVKEDRYWGKECTANWLQWQSRATAEKDRVKEIREAFLPRHHIEDTQATLLGRPPPRIKDVPKHRRKYRKQDLRTANHQILGLNQLKTEPGVRSSGFSPDTNCRATFAPVISLPNPEPTNMASLKKYAGLPDMDEGEEIYETQPPELTEASTLPTDSVSDSEDENAALDRATLDTNAARQRFRPAVVDARGANFSDTIDGGRQDYRTRSRRRRKRAQLVEGDDDRAEAYDSDDETLQGRLARLQREAAELQAEIDQIEREKNNHDADDASTYEDAEDHQANKLSSGVLELNDTLQAISIGKKTRPARTLEEEFMQRLEQPSRPPDSIQPHDEGGLSASSISAIAAFSDRLTALETVLGVSAQSQTTSSSVIPTLDNLSAQIENLTSTLAPRHETDGTSASSTSTVHLDPIAQKIRHLLTESKRLEDSRKAATKSFEELLESRDRYANLLQSTQSHSAIHPTTDLARTNGQDAPATNGMPSKEQMQSQFTTLFLDDQASRISALYNILPTIQSLQPLLPVVLERLRALSGIHTGAAEVRNELDEMEQRLQVQEQDVKKWREAVENAEKAMQEGREVMKENVKVVGDMVKGLESRVRALN